MKKALPTTLFFAGVIIVILANSFVWPWSLAVGMALVIVAFLLHSG
jgi:hypothetical protein